MVPLWRPTRFFLWGTECGCISSRGGLMQIRLGNLRHDENQNFFVFRPAAGRTASSTRPASSP
ncbi:hypothetical protein PUN4_260023 [Paraburkholderia unamae]|nr:hypothetical protein PUN4_260023 [Paraburkholderia unamae]